ncbi:MAG: hypothetical protein ACLGPL_00900, partial [Acidobacteriota bacterium]
SGKSIGDSGVGEILKSRGFYAGRIGVPLDLAVVTNRDMTENAQVLARENGVQVFGRGFLSQELTTHRISIADVLQAEEKRLGSAY